MKRSHYKAAIICAVLVLLSLICTVVLLLWIPSLKIGRYERAYNTLEKGATKRQVFEVMGEPTRVNVPPTDYWDEIKLDSSETLKIAETIDYSVSTFYLPVTYRFSFDTNGHLIGKHRYK